MSRLVVKVEALKLLPLLILMNIMNYLAHIFLSGDRPRVQIGNFIGDAVKGKAYRGYLPEFQQGIWLHRQIDTFCDTHPVVREAVDMGREVCGRYAGVVTDILWDYFLARDFRSYAGLPLKRYAHRFYWVLIKNYFYLPPRFKGFLWHFITTDRLVRYASPEGIRQSLEIMATYRGLGVNPARVIHFLHIHEEELREMFSVFFPELQIKCRQIRENNFVPEGFRT